jgi:hypothetical protein
MNEQLTFWEKLFGVNWKTTLTGFLAFVFFAGSWLGTHQNALGFLPVNWIGPINSICAGLGLINALLFAFNTKDKNVTGGTTEVHYGYHRRNLSHSYMSIARAKSDSKVFMYISLRIFVFLVLAVLIFEISRSI